jgi:hypothetical protein
MKWMDVLALAKSCFDLLKFEKGVAEQAVKPYLAALKAKVESGAIDPIKGTDLDKMAMLAALDQVNKLIDAELAKAANGVL